MEYIFIHGLGQTSYSWDNVINHFFKPIDTVSIDLSFFMNKEDNSYKNLFDSFSSYCDSINNPINICGISLGAVLGLNYAINNPHIVKSLVLMAPQYKIPKILFGIQATIFKFMPQSFFLKLGLSKHEFITLLNSMKNLNLEHSLDKITCPTLIICGKKDKANLKASKRLKNKLTNAEIHIIEKAGHEVNIDSPVKLSNIINKFYIRNNL